METKYKKHCILEVVLLFISLEGLPAGNLYTEEDSRYLDAVREFADNVLKYGKDTYGPKHTPLFVDGLNTHSHELVKRDYYKRRIISFLYPDRETMVYDLMSLNRGMPWRY